MEVKTLDKYLTVSEVAENLKIPVATIRDWLRRGHLKGVRLGRHWRVKEIDFKSFIKEQEVAQSTNE